MTSFNATLGRRRKRAWTVRTVTSKRHFSRVTWRNGLIPPYKTEFGSPISRVFSIGSAFRLYREVRRSRSPCPKLGLGRLDQAIATLSRVLGRSRQSPDVFLVDRKAFLLNRKALLVDRKPFLVNRK